MLRNSTKGWHLYCHNHRRRNLNAYPNIYFRESFLLSKGISTIWFNYRNDDLKNLEGKEIMRYILHHMVTFLLEMKAIHMYC